MFWSLFFVLHASECVGSILFSQDSYTNADPLKDSSCRVAYTVFEFEYALGMRTCTKEFIEDRSTAFNKSVLLQMVNIFL